MVLPARRSIVPLFHAPLLWASIVPLLLAGCAGQGGEPVEPLLDGGGQPYVEPDPESEGMPPFVFEARPHTPRQHTVWTAPPAMGSLPPLKTSSRCWRPGRRPVDDVAIAGGHLGNKKNTTRPKVKPTPSKPYVVRPYTGGDAASEQSPPVQRRPTEPRSDAPSKRGRTSSRDLDDSGYAGGPLDEGDPMSDATPGGMPGAANSAAEASSEEAVGSQSQERRRSNRRGKSRRKRDREAKDAAPSSMPAPEPAAEADMRQDPYGGAPVTQPVVAAPEWPPTEEGWGDAFFLSNDDSMSLSSAQRLIYAIEHYLPLPAEHVRPHELLNYFSFETAAVDEDYDFSVRGEIAAQPNDQGLHELALAIDSRPVTRDSRRNVNLTLVVDRSGSMREEGRMDYLKRGMLDMVRQLKPGDVISMVSFDHRVCVPLQHFVVGRDDPTVLTRAIHDLKPRGNTNLHAGLEEGYRLADGAYRDTYSNRVLLVTDALANTGVTDSSTMSMVTDYFDSRRIRLSGIGVGREFNDRLLDRMTEKGRGAYVFLGSEAEVDAIFGPRFISLIETVANDVHFRLHLPPTMRLQQFHGEQASTRREEVQAIHYFANTSQLFLAEVEAWQGELRPRDTVMLEVEYEHAESGESLIEEFVIPVGEMLERDQNLRKGTLVMQWVDGLRALAYLAAPGGWRPEPAGWPDPYGAQLCADGRQALHGQAAPLSDDPEVRNLLRLWDVACARYGQPRRPTRRNESGWPGAAGRR